MIIMINNTLQFFFLHAYGHGFKYKFKIPTDKDMKSYRSWKWYEHTGYDFVSSKH